ncbi:hypothetical protein KY284_000806 [Solanum tuberosum]|nr:hypothetical protein KY284_000806 [Solanum tuberosum]
MAQVWDPERRWRGAYATTHQTFVKLAILRGVYDYVNTKWQIAVESVIFVSLATVALTNKEVITKDKSYFILDSGQWSVCTTNITTILKHYFDYFSGLGSIKEQPLEHESLNTDVVLGVLKVGKSWFHSNNKEVALDSLSSLDRNTIVIPMWLHSNLEDKAQ